MVNQTKQQKYLSLIKEHEGIIHKVIGLYIHDSEDKKDIYQEVLLQAWKGYQNFRADSKFSTWLYKVTLNTVLSFTKKNRKEDSRLDTEIIETETPKEDYELLYLIINQMNEIDKMLISLHLDGYKHKEISEITGMTTNNITVKIHRLKASIIEKFKLLNNA